MKAASTLSSARPMSLPPMRMWDLASLARAWMRAEGFHSAAARLHSVAPEPPTRPDLDAFVRALGLRASAGARPDPVVVARALQSAAEHISDLHMRRALMEAADKVLEDIYP